MGQGQVLPIEAKVSALTEFPVPNSRRELRHFLCMAGYYRKVFTVFQPLTNFTSPKVAFDWSPDCQHVFETVKALLCHAPVLATPDFSSPFLLEADASAVEAVCLNPSRSEWVPAPCQLLLQKIHQESITLLSH